MVDEDKDKDLTRRAYLAVSATSVAAVAGCPGGGSSTESAAPGTDSDGQTPTDTDGESTDSPQGSDGTDAMTDGSMDTETATGTDEPAETETAEPTDTDVEPEPADTGQGVLVNQVGYRPDDPKLAVVRTAAETYEVVDADSGEAVASGDLSDPTEDPNSGDTVRHAEFSGLSESGTYRLSVGDGAADSYEFAVGTDVWGRTLAELGRRYTLRRANVAIDDPVTGLSWDVGYPQDAEAVMYFGDDYHDEGDTVDMTGGWYDAGDYGKYVTPGAITAAQLLLAYEQYPDTFSEGQFAIPESLRQDDTAGMPDLLAEVKYKLEWLAKMQRPDGAAYHKVSGENWPGMSTAPDEDDQTRYVYGLSTYGTGMLAGTFAMAARIYREFDPDFADRMLDRAKNAFGYLTVHDPIFRQDEGQNSGSGGYRKDNDRTERFWAGAELLKTTGDERYQAYLDQQVSGMFEAESSSVSWANSLLLGHWAYYTADAATEERRSQVADSITGAADDLVEHIQSEGYRVSLRSDEYVWASAKIAVAKGCLLLLANEVDPSEEYVAHALDQIHYVLGRTPTAYSYVTGSGEQAPQNPHSRTVGSTGINVPGNVVGGPNASGDDPVLSDYIASEDPAPAKSYVDRTGSYASNEPAIDYAAPVVFALAHFTPGDAVGLD